MPEKISWKSWRQREADKVSRDIIGRRNVRALATDPIASAVAPTVAVVLYLAAGAAGVIWGSALVAEYSSPVFEWGTPVSWIIVLGAVATPALIAVAMCRRACAMFEGDELSEKAPASDMRGRYHEFRAAILKRHLGPSRFAVLSASPIAYPTMHGLVTGLITVVTLAVIQLLMGETIRTDVLIGAISAAYGTTAFVLYVCRNACVPKRDDGS